MHTGSYRFDRLEFAGSLGDLGTLIPLSVALILITGLSATSVLVMVGLFYIISGLYYKLPIPVQPLKVVSAIAIAFPDKISLTVIGASGILFGAILILLALSGIIDVIARYFTKPVIRGIQLGLGFILIHKGTIFLLQPELFIHQSSQVILVAGVPLNLLIGIAGFIIALILLPSKHFPAALVIVSIGIIAGIIWGAFDDINFLLGPTNVDICIPGKTDLLSALFLLVIPQLPLTLGNAVMGTADTSYALFGKGARTARVSHRALSLGMGIINVLTGFIGAMPMCHGAGGLAAHYRFGARTGGSNIMIGIIFLILGVLFGKISISILSSIPGSILGILLIFAGIELGLLIRDLSEKNDLFVAILIAGIGFSTTNMGIAFIAGIVVKYLIEWRKIQI